MQANFLVSDCLLVQKNPPKPNTPPSLTLSPQLGSDRAGGGGGTPGASLTDLLAAAGALGSAVQDVGEQLGLEGGGGPLPPQVRVHHHRRRRRRRLRSTPSPPPPVPASALPIHTLPRPPLRNVTLPVTSRRGDVAPGHVTATSRGKRRRSGEGRAGLQLGRARMASCFKLGVKRCAK